MKDTQFPQKKNERYTSDQIIGRLGGRGIKIKVLVGWRLLETLLK